MKYNVTRVGNIHIIILYSTEITIYNKQQNIAIRKTKQSKRQSPIGIRHINDVYQSLIIRNFYFGHCDIAITIRCDGQSVRTDDD